MNLRSLAQIRAALALLHPRGTGRAVLKPLSGKVVVVTRPKAQSRSMIAALSKAGARVIEAPLIRIAPPSSYKRLDEALKSLKGYDGVVFTSRNGVESFFKRARALRLKPKRPARLYAVGAETARALEERGWNGAKRPKVHHGEALARAIGSVRGLKLLIPRAKVARETLPGLLRRKGARVAVAQAYRTVADRGSVSILKALARRGVDAVAFASGSAVEQFVSQLGAERSRRLFRTAKAVSIGPVTSAALRARGIKPASQAKRATSDGLVHAVKESLSRA